MHTRKECCIGLRMKKKNFAKKSTALRKSIQNIDNHHSMINDYNRDKDLFIL